MINNLVQQVQSQLLPQDDTPTYEQYLKTLDETSQSRKDLIKRLNTIYDISPLKPEIYNKRVLADLDFYKSNGTPVFETLNHTQTSFGEKYLRRLLSTPLDDITLLKQRQAKLKILAKDPKLLKNLTEAIANIQSTEKTLLWFWNPPSPEMGQLHDMIYYNIPAIEQINENTLFMQLTNLYKMFAVPAITVLSPIMTIILPYIFLKFLGADASMTDIYTSLTQNVAKMAAKFSFGLGTAADGKPSTIVKYLSIAMWVVFYIQGAYSSILNAYNTNKIINNIHTKANQVSQFITSHQTLLTHLTKAGFKTEHLQSQCSLTPLFSHKVFTTTPQLISNKGVILTAYYKLLKLKDQLIPAMQLIGEIDAYLTITKLITTHNFSFTTFIDPHATKKPVIKLKEAYHPVIPKSRLVTNSIAMSEKSSTHHLITGPNKAGKSTYIKSVIISLILSQTLTISNSSRASITPFSYIDSYLNIPDCEGKESLYEAELNRCYEHLQTVAKYKTQKHKYMFTIMDEIFSSTNNMEGRAAAHAILKHLSNQPNSAYIVTTHYYELSKLEDETKKSIRNYKFTCETSSSTQETTFDYKIQRGASDQYIALQLLKDKGFNHTIIEDAYKVFNKYNTSNCVSKNVK